MILEFVLVIVIFLNLVLSFFVISLNPRAQTNRFFSLVSFLAAIWTFTNFMTGINPTPFWLQSTYAAGSFVTAIGLIWITSFAEKKVSKKFISIILALAIFFAVASYFPGFIASRYDDIYAGGVFTGKSGWGLVLYSVFFITAALLMLWKVFSVRAKTTNQQRRLQLASVGVGAAITLTISAFTSFIFPSFDIFAFGGLDSVGFLGFLSLIAYGITRQGLFDIKVIATELVTFVLWVALIVHFFIAQSPWVRFADVILLVFLIIFGVLLIRSVRKEIQQKEQLAKLDKELEQANEELKALDQARADFISIASHQLRTPPATIKWYLAAVIGGDFGPISEQVKKAVSSALVTDNSLISLIDDLLNASRIERGKMEFIFEPTDLVQITQLTVDQLLPLAIQRKQTLTFELPKSKIPAITADKEKLRQVINNFIDNSIKYTQTGGTINVSITKTPKEITLKVKDNGRGMSKETLASVFEKYNRGGKNSDSQGLGLGLYVAKVVIEQHKGKIWAESEGEGKGSSFCLSIPIKSDLKMTTFDLAKPDQKINLHS